MKKLVLFGDSLFGRSGKNLILLLEAKLTDKYDVYNCAAGGWDSSDLIKKSDYIATLKPDVLVLSVGTNDVCSWKRVELADYRANTEKVLDIFKNSRIIFFLPPPVHEVSRPADKQISNVDVKKYHDAAMIICEKLSVEYVDSWRLFMPIQDNGISYHLEDGVHLSDYGYEVLYSEISRILSE